MINKDTKSTEITRPVLVHAIRDEEGEYSSPYTPIELQDLINDRLQKAQALAELLMHIDIANCTESTLHNSSWLLHDLLTETHQLSNELWQRVRQPLAAP